MRVGINGRLDTIQAAILLAKLDGFDEEIAGRQQVASWYSELLPGTVEAPAIPDGYTSAWAQYTVKSDSRDQLLAQLKAAGIPTAIYYPKPLHMQGAFGLLGYESGDMPVSEVCAKSVFSLPMHPGVTRDQVKETVGVIGLQ